MTLMAILLRHRISRELIFKLCTKFENGEWRSASLRKIFRKYYGIDAGYGSYGWAYSKIEGPAVIGAYTSIGSNVQRIPVNHPTDGVSTHPCCFNPVFGWVDRDIRERKTLTIGNDVWIGNNVTILAGCEMIGDGAVIGNGAVVTKNIPGYEVWGGVPAHFIKDRVSKEIAEKLRESRWWEEDEAVLKHYVGYFTDIEKFLVEFLKDRKND